jgi:hypothetical protein
MGKGRAVLQSEVNTLYSPVYGIAVATRVYDDQTFIVDSVSLDATQANKPLLVRVYLSPAGTVHDWEDVVMPGETISKKLPPGQRYNLTQTSYSLLWQD